MAEVAWTSTCGMLRIVIDGHKADYVAEVRRQDAMGDWYWGDAHDDAEIVFQALDDLKVLTRKFKALRDKVDDLIFYVHAAKDRNPGPSTLDEIDDKLKGMVSE